MSRPVATAATVAIVIQRFGAEVFGGAEAHARQTADSLRTDFEVEVLTTCARDYTRWDNAYAPGVTQEDGVLVRRFPVEGLRDPQFDILSSAFYSGGADEKEQRFWLEAQGPVAPALLDYLETHQDDYEAVFFYTYLYHPTVEGVRRAAGRSILVSTCHDEPPLKFAIFRQLFEQARVLLFLTPEEQQLVQGRFPEQVAGKPQWVIGAPVDVPAGVAARGDEPGEAPAELLAAGLDPHGPFLVYVGRLDEGKGCGELIRHFRHFRQRWQQPLQLLMLGRHHMELPGDPAIVAPGPVSEAVKWWALGHATLTVMPSRMESLCLVVLESWAAGTPVLCVGGEVLKGHVLRSGGGLFYDDGVGFRLALELLLGDGELRRGMARGGGAYVREHFSPERFGARLREAIAAAAPAARVLS